MTLNNPRPDQGGNQVSTPTPGRLPTEQFSDLFTSFQKSAFRLEARREYRVEQEEELVRDFLAGKPLPSDTNEAWCRLIENNVAAGKTMVRVHVMPTFLTAYLRFEIEWGYLYSADAGEQILLLQNDDPAEVFGKWPIEDFWLFDDSTGVHMHYDDDGLYQFAELVTDPATVASYRQVRDVAVKHAMPLETYLARVRRIHGD